MRLGALTIHLVAEHRTWADAFVSRFRCRPEQGRPTDPDVVLTIDSSLEAVPPAGDVDRRLEVDRTDTTVRYHTDVMSLEADLATRPAGVTVRVRPEGQRIPHLHHYFTVLVDKLLLSMGAIRLHGAAIDFGGATSVFLGDKGAGKSTLSLALGLAGGRVLADDQLLVRRTAAGFGVSGVDDRIRLTAESEAHFLPGPLDVPPRDYAGVLKKEIALGCLVPTIPHRDLTPRRLYFPRVGRRFTVRPVSGREAVTRILGGFARSQRFADDQDRLALLRLVAELCEAVDTADLELSPDLGELHRLVVHVSS